MMLSTTEKKLLLHLKNHGSKSSVTTAAQSPDFAQSEDTARAAAEKLVHLGLCTKQNVSQTSIDYTDEGIKAADLGLPEVRLLSIASKGDAQISSLEPYLRSFGILWAKKKGWIQTTNGMITLTSDGKQAAKFEEYLTLPKNASDILGFEQSLILELERRGLITITTRVSDTTLELTPNGESQSAKIDLASDDLQISTITRHMLISGSWRGKEFTPYDIQAPVSQTLAARRHPINRLAQKIGDIFVQMGFEQMQGPLCESCFWNFDALFQPQDHPARDLADTFYLDGKSPLPKSKLVENVKKSHESGWKYSWSSDEASKQVLRTHTTSVSARTLFKNKDNSQPMKFFSIGKVFRNEATDYKHLAEFYQVEGIISWEGATFRHLLGTLREFYSRLGFEKIRFRPSYFPYTEPSLEIEVFYEERQEWIELGGAGILRPEVTTPICGKYPVLAWGLSLERPLMLADKINDIRTLYRNDLDWLRNFKSKV